MNPVDPQSQTNRDFPSGQLPLTALFHRVGMISKSNMVSRVKKEKIFQSKMRPGCIAALHGIGIMQPVSQKELSDWLGFDPSDIVGLIDDLENAGLVERKRDQKDRRRQLISLTSKGVSTHKRVLKIGAAALDETLAPLNVKERKTLQDMLTRVFEYHLKEQ